MPRICLRLSHPRGVLRPSKCSIQIVTSRTWTSSATTRPTPPQSPRIAPHPSSPSSNVGTVPDLCLGAGGKAPGFVQQMLFSAPVQEKQAKGNSFTFDRHHPENPLTPL